MEFRQLEYFVAVAEELHFSNAAKRLHMTQPPLSQQIQRLEDELQVQLFERTKRSVTLTEAGKVLLEEAQPILERMALAKKRCRRADNSVTGELVIGFIPIALDLLIVNLLNACSQQYPGIRLSLLEMGTNEQLAALRSGQIQIGFIQTQQSNPDGLDSMLMISESYLLAIPASHELARRKRIPIKALRGVHLILPPRQVQPGVYDAIIGSCRGAGFEPLLDYVVNGKHAALSLVAQGLGVTPISASYLRDGKWDVVCRPLVSDWPRMEVRMVWVAGAIDSGLAGVLDMAKQMGQKQSGNQSQPPGKR